MTSYENIDAEKIDCPNLEINKDYFVFSSNYTKNNPKEVKNLVKNEKLVFVYLKQGDLDNIILSPDLKDKIQEKTLDIFDKIFIKTLRPKHKHRILNLIDKILPNRKNKKLGIFKSSYIILHYPLLEFDKFTEYIKNTMSKSTTELWTPQAGVIKGILKEPVKNIINNNSKISI